jgi:hypothetical protein
MQIWKDVQKCLPDSGILSLRVLIFDKTCLTSIGGCWYPDLFGPLATIPTIHAVTRYDEEMEMIKSTSSFTTVIVPIANMLSKTARTTCFCLIKMLIFSDVGLVAHLRATVNTADQCMLEYFMFILQILSDD